MIDKDLLRKFSSKFSRFAQIPEAEWEAFYALVRSRKLSKNSHLLKPDQISRLLTFVCEGLLRIYNLRDGEEVNIAFFPEETLANSFISFIEQQPSEYGIEVLEDSNVLTISHDAMMKLGKRHKCWMEMALGSFNL